MKTKRRMICILVLVIMMAGMLSVPGGAVMHIESNKTPQGVGTAVPVPEQNGAAESADEEENDQPVDVVTSVSANGILSVSIDTENTGRMKVKITKGNETLYYDVDSDYHLNIPLQMGNGSYTVKVFSHVQGSDYQAVFSEDFVFAAEDPNDVFLASSEIVNFAESQNIDSLTNQVVDGATEEMEIATRIADFVIAELKYDTQKAETLTADYIPNIDSVLADKSGICYDFAAVTASMLREAGIPAKLVMGYRSDSDLYHAWNEVLIDGEWVVVDTTWDNVMNNHHMSVQNPGLYSAEKVF